MYVLNLIALLTINLGVFNLLPIPALDGGSAVLYAYRNDKKKAYSAGKRRYGPCYRHDAVIWSYHICFV